MAGLLFIVGFLHLPLWGAVRVEGDPDSGFHWPYFLSASQAARDRGETGEIVHILVVPNNSGRTSEDLSYQEEHLVEAIDRNYAPLADALGTVLLSPVFPRPSSHPQLYTHALDRDSLTTDLPGLARLDLQLIAMLDDATHRLESRGWKVSGKVLMVGFSASGMFANRFTVLHPEHVLAAAIGSPGGWPIAPVDVFRDHRLRYPIGIADVDELIGRPIDLAELRRTPLLIFMGDRDENDSVDYHDGYEERDRQLIDRLFGSRPVERWDDAEALYQSAELRAEFKLYPGIAHVMCPDMIRDVTVFLREQLQKQNR